MAKTGHKHAYRIVAHTTDRKGKDVRVLIGCKCSDTDVLKPHQGKKTDPDFEAKVKAFPHLCCDPGLAHAA